MNVPVCYRWVVAPFVEESGEEVNAISAQEVDEEVDEEDWRQPITCSMGGSLAIQGIR